MTRWRSNDYDCSGCGWGEVDMMVDIDVHDQDDLECPECGTTLTRAIGVPLGLRASYADGQGRGGAAGQTYNNLLTAAKLEGKMMSLPVEKRGEMRSEIRKLRRTKK